MKRLRHNPDEGIGNRQVSTSAKKVKFWCWSCDAQLIGPGERCPNCGKKDKSGKRK